MKYSKADLRQAVGPLRLCAEYGCEAAIHAMSKIFEEKETEDMIFVDASNAFNSLNREATLVNSQSVCPSLAPVIINTYRNPSSLFVGGETILSLKGTTQGDPLGLTINAIASQPLAKRITGIAKQAWFTDDSTAGSSLEKLSQWWEELSWIGPLYGYYPNSSKTILLVKLIFQDEVNKFFGNTGVQITTEGGKYMGAPLALKCSNKHLLLTRLMNG